MTRVMAQGTFDILHPGHLHYLERSRELGDELVVVIARDSRVSERKDLVLGERSRRDIVDALKMVDEAVLGSEDDIFDSVEKLQPDIITLGYDQVWDEEELEQMLANSGFSIEVVRIGAVDEDLSSTRLRNQIRDRTEL